MKIGDLVRCKNNRHAPPFWHRKGIGLITGIIPNTWSRWPGPCSTCTVRVLWTDGSKDNFSTKWLEVIRENR